MNINYIDDNGKLQKLSVIISQKWDDIKCNNSKLKSIFSFVDNKNSTKGDGVIDFEEIHILSHLLKMADKYVDNRKPDNILQKDEAQMLYKKLKTTGIKYELQYYKSDLSDEAIVREFPSDQYTFKFESNPEYNISTRSIRPKNNSHCFATITRYDDKNIIASGITSHEESVRSSFSIDNSGRKIKYSIGNVPTDEELAKKLVSELKINATTNNKAIIQDLLSLIDKDNIQSVLNSIYSINKQIIGEIFGKKMSFIRIDIKQMVMKHLTKCYEESIEYTHNYCNNNSQINNKWHKGDSYSIKQNDDILTIKNKRTGKISEINLETFLKGFDKFNDKIRMKKLIRELPGEILEDLSAECSDISGKRNIFYELAKIFWKLPHGMFEGIRDNISVPSLSKDVLIHELGHAVDHKIGMHESVYNREFNRVYKKEMEKYKKAGNKQYSFIKKTGVYCTANKQEMFAECYRMLMTGEECTQIITEYFPETLKVVEKMVKETRKMSDTKRHLYQI